MPPVAKDVKIEVEWVLVDSIQPNDWNPNRQTEEQFELLLQSMRSDGFTQPIFVVKEGRTIVDGFHRWKAGKALGFSKVPVVWADMTIQEHMQATLQFNWARGQEESTRVAEIMRELLDVMDPNELALQLQVSEEDIKLEIEVNLPDVDLSELFTGDEGIADDGGIPPEISDLLRNTEYEMSEQVKDEEKSMRKKDAGDFYFVSFAYTVKQGEIVEGTFGKIDKPQPEAFMDICRAALKKGW